MALSQRELNALIKAAQAQEDKHAKAVLKMLEQARKDIIAELGKDPTQWRFTFLAELLRRVNDRLNKVTAEFKTIADEAMIDAAKRGAAIGMAGNSAGAVMSMVEIDPQLLNALADYRADLIKGVTDSCRDKITSIIRRSILTGKSLADVQKQIGTVLPKGKGIMKNIAWRSETILRTEYGHILGKAGQLSMEKSAEVVPGLMKKWVIRAQGKGGTSVRPSHLAANGQTVPVNEPFIVGGEKLMYPHDPAGSAGNIINCQCASIPVVPDEQPQED
jgi:uncharacterized protein with gpF-like domain